MRRGRLKSEPNKPPPQADIIGTIIISKSSINILEIPANAVLTSIKNSKGPAIHNPQRQEFRGQKIPNTNPEKKYIRPRTYGKGFMSGRKIIATPTITAKMYR